MHSNSSLAAVGRPVDIQPGGLLQFTPAHIERQSAGGHTWEPQPPLHGAACPFWPLPAVARAGFRSQASNRSKVALPVMAASESLADRVPGGRSTTWITDGRRSIC